MPNVICFNPATGRLMIHGEDRTRYRRLIREELKRRSRRCVYCRRTCRGLCLDHLRPLGRGGDDSPTNLALVCGRCNRFKGTDSLRQFRDRLLTMLANVEALMAERGC